MDITISVSIFQKYEDYESLYVFAKEIDDNNLKMISCHLMVDSAQGVAQAVNQLRHPYSCIIAFHVISDFLNREANTIKEKYWKEIFANLNGACFRAFAVCKISYKKDTEKTALAPLKNEISKEVFDPNSSIDIEKIGNILCEYEIFVMKCILILAWDNLLNRELSESLSTLKDI